MSNLSFIPLQGLFIFIFHVIRNDRVIHITIYIYTSSYISTVDFMCTDMG